METEAEKVTKRTARDKRKSSNEQKQRTKDCKYFHTKVLSKLNMNKI